MRRFVEKTIYYRLRINSAQCAESFQRYPPNAETGRHMLSDRIPFKVFSLIS